jgi:hypothetical protein
MVFPPSKPADRYNMEVAALMKYGNIDAFGYDLKNASVSMYPDPIFANMSLLGVRLSFDIIGSTSHWEIFAECKFAEEPKPISVNSFSFTQSLAECISADPLTKAGNKAYKFSFICNGDTTGLVQDVNELRVSNDAILEKYLEKVKTAALRKWSGSEPKVDNITINHLRKYLVELRILTIDNGTLSSLRADPVYMELCRQIYSERPLLSQIDDNESPPRSVILAYLGDEFLTARWKGIRISISEQFVKWLMSHRLGSQELIKELAFEDIPSAVNLKYRYPPDLPPEGADESITACANNELLECGSSHLAVLALSKNRIYLIKHEEFFQRISGLSETDYGFRLTKVKEELSLPIGGSFLKLAIQETHRSKGLIFPEDLFRE